jgi:hypothetical protein
MIEDRPWGKIETDKMLDWFLSGRSSGEVARMMNRPKDEVKRRIRRLIFNRKDKAVNYHPVRRLPRKGKPISETEQRIINIWKKKELPAQHLARLFARDLKEILPKFNTINAWLGHQELKRSKCGTGVDLCLAYRICRDCFKFPVMTDNDLEALEQEEIEYGVGGDRLKEPWDRAYPPKLANSIPRRVLGLAQYLYYRHKESMTPGKEWLDALGPYRNGKTSPD